MKRIILPVVILFVVSSCSIDFAKEAREAYGNGKTGTADFKAFAMRADSVLSTDVKPGKIVVPDSVKGMFGLHIYCIEKYLLDLVRDSSGGKYEKLYSSRDTFAWISDQKIATSIFHALDGDSTCVKGMSDLQENYIKTGFPWLLVIEPYDVRMPYVLKDKEDEFMGGVFLADVYLVDYKKNCVLARFEFEGGNNESVRYKEKLLRDEFSKKIKEDFMENVKKQMGEKLAAALGYETLPGQLSGLEEGGFFTNYAKTKELFDGIKKNGDSVAGTDSVKK